MSLCSHRRIYGGFFLMSHPQSLWKPMPISFQRQRRSSTEYPACIPAADVWFCERRAWSTKLLLLRSTDTSLPPLLTTLHCCRWMGRVTHAPYHESAPSAHSPSTCTYILLHYTHKPTITLRQTADTPSCSATTRKHPFALFCFI